MKNAVKHALKYAGLAAFCIAAGVALWFANGIFGNPVSKALSRAGAQAYIKTVYPGAGYVVGEVPYNFKTGNYCAKITSPFSGDTYFTVYLNMVGKALGDSYDDVRSRWTTFQRLEGEYRRLVASVLDAPDFPLQSDLCYGTLLMADEAEAVLGPGAPGIVTADLTLDGQYDVRELGKTAGHLVYYAAETDLSPERAARALLLLKTRMDEAGTPFYSIDFILETPRVEGKPRVDADYFSTEGVLYADIYEEGLAARLAAANKALMARYAAADDEKAAWEAAQRAAQG